MVLSESDYTYFSLSTGVAQLWIHLIASQLNGYEELMYLKIRNVIYLYQIS